MLSVNSNYGASIALQSLNSTNKELNEVQNRISTGLKVAIARDNGAVYAIAEGQRARVSSVAAVKDGIDRASSTVDVALAAGKSVGEILQKLKAKAVAAQADDLTSDQRAALQADFDQPSLADRHHRQRRAVQRREPGAGLATSLNVADLRPRRLGRRDDGRRPVGCLTRRSPARPCRLRRSAPLGDIADGDLITFALNDSVNRHVHDRCRTDRRHDRR